MSTIFSATEMAWVNMPPEQKEIFNNIAYKDGNPDLGGFEWFEHLVPDAIQDQPDMVEVFMNGGTVTKEVWVPDRGVGNGHYEQMSFDIADKDVSRITSGANGGEYTPDNTIMEDMALNRSRGAEDMTPTEFDAAESLNAADASILDGAEALDIVSVGPATTPIGGLAAGAEASDGLGESLLEGIIPITYGLKLAHETYKGNHGKNEGERLAASALVGGATVATTYTALSLIPGLNIVLGGIALFKLGQAVVKAAAPPQGLEVGAPGKTMVYQDGKWTSTN